MLEKVQQSWGMLLLLLKGGTLAWLVGVSSKAPAISYPSPEKLHISYLLTSEGKILFVHGVLVGNARNMDCSDASL